VRRIPWRIVRDVYLTGGIAMPYVFFDLDSRSETFGKYSVRDGYVSYDGFDTEAEAYEFIETVLGA
jgi:hypothetical protein